MELPHLDHALSIDQTYRSRHQFIGTKTAIMLTPTGRDIAKRTFRHSRKGAIPSLVANEITIFFITRRIKKTIQLALKKGEKSYDVI